ncbi:phage tail protein [Morganella morganii]
MNLKSALLKPDSHTEKYTLFGTEVYLRRLTVGELDRYEKDRKAAFDAGDYSGVTLAGASLILSAICDENGIPVSAEDLPTAKELIDAHSNPVFVEAMNTLQKYCYGTIEDAKKN